MSIDQAVKNDYFWESEIMGLILLIYILKLFYKEQW